MVFESVDGEKVMTDFFWYVRGCSNDEAGKNLNGRNGQVSAEVTHTNRNEGEPTLAFGISKNKSVDIDILKKTFPEFNYYAIVGVHAENGQSARNFINKDYSGKIMVFAFPYELPIHEPNLGYGEEVWGTTSELPDDASRYLIGVFDSNCISGPSESNILPRKEGFLFQPSNEIKQIFNLENLSFKGDFFPEIFVNFLMQFRKLK